MQDTLVHAQLGPRAARCDRSRRTHFRVDAHHLFIAMLLVALASAIAVPGYHRNLTEPPEQTITIKVASNETLWQIARRYPIKGYGTSETIEVIRQVNGLVTSGLSEGQIIQVPVTDATQPALATR